MLSRSKIRVHLYQAKWHFNGTNSTKMLTLQNAYACKNHRERERGEEKRRERERERERERDGSWTNGDMCFKLQSTLLDIIMRA